MNNHQQPCRCAECVDGENRVVQTRTCVPVVPVQALEEEMIRTLGAPTNWPSGWLVAARVGERVSRAAPRAAIYEPDGAVARSSQIITLCGSARFERLFKAWNEALTMAGHTVFSLTAYQSDKAGVKQWYTEEQKAALDAAHFRKIEASDAIFVLNLHAYIGESTLREIEYAKKLGKTVYFLESWGPGFGIGGSHTDEAQRAAIADGLALPTASPIDTTTRSGAKDPWAIYLLGPAGKLRSSIVDLTKRAALAAPVAAIDERFVPMERIGRLGRDIQATKKAEDSMALVAAFLRECALAPRNGPTAADAREKDLQRERELLNLFSDAVHSQLIANEQQIQILCNELASIARTAERGGLHAAITKRVKQTIKAAAKSREEASATSAQGYPPLPDPMAAMMPNGDRYAFTADHMRGYVDADRKARQLSACNFCLEQAAEARASLGASDKAPASDAQDMVQVPRKFIQGFGTLAHNYSLKAIPPEYYSGTEGDAFSNAYRRCGQDLAKLRDLIDAAQPGSSQADEP